MTVDFEYTQYVQSDANEERHAHFTLVFLYLYHFGRIVYTQSSGLTHVTGLLLLFFLMSCVKHSGVRETCVPPTP